MVSSKRCRSIPTQPSSCLRRSKRRKVLSDVTPEPLPQRKKGHVRKVSSHQFEKSILKADHPQLEMPLPEPYPSRWSKYEHPTSNCKLPDVCISENVFCPIKFGKKLCKDDGHQSKVQWQDRATVMTIPSWVHYSYEDRERMWRKDFDKVEYWGRKESEWEGKNWRKYLEEEQMIRYKGKLYHPVYFRDLFELETRIMEQRRSPVKRNRSRGPLLLLSPRQQPNLEPVRRVLVRQTSKAAAA